MCDIHEKNKVPVQYTLKIITTILEKNQPIQEDKNSWFQSAGFGDFYPHISWYAVSWYPHPCCLELSCDAHDIEPYHYDDDDGDSNPVSGVHAVMACCGVDLTSERTCQ